MFEDSQKKRIVDIYEYMPVLRELIEEGKEVSFTVTGNSMSPFIVHGRDQIIIEKPVDKWKKGDIGFFQRANGAYILHRICRIDKQGNCWFVGDGQQDIEGPILQEQIFAKVTAVKRKGKWIRKGNFWWEFFARFWIRVIPLRPWFHRLYGVLKRLLRRS